MRIKTTLYQFYDKGSVDVYLAEKEIVPFQNFNMLNTEARHRYTFEFSEAVKIKSKEKFNVIISYNEIDGRSNNEQLFANLNLWQRHKLKWMFNEHHIQKEWKWWVGIVLTITTIGLTILSKWTDIVNLLAR